MICLRPDSYFVCMADRVFSRICGFVEQVFLWGARNSGAPGVSCKNGKAPFDRLRANGSCLEIIIVPSAPAEPLVSFAPDESIVSSAYAEPAVSFVPVELAVSSVPATPVVSFAPAGPLVSCATAGPVVYSAHAEPVEAPMMNDYYEPIL